MVKGLPSPIALLEGGLIVSCQAEAHEPLHGAAIMAAMAVAAAEGGAVGIRANGPEDIRAIRQAVDLPIIGILKVDLAEYEVRITPRLQDARHVAQAGADIVALDATARPRPDFESLADFIQAVRGQTGCPVMADISTFDEGIMAARAGADLVGTTLSGYTPYSRQEADPDMALVERLAGELDLPVIAEGKIATPAQARHALDLGAFAVVVGAAISRPQWITRQFVQKMVH
jgi:N-acylglucosamine-6-phosphate 2-epimerase